jgi:hypothetical protein
MGTSVSCGGRFVRGRVTAEAVSIIGITVAHARRSQVKLRVLHDVKIDELFFFKF